MIERTCGCLSGGGQGCASGGAGCGIDGEGLATAVPVAAETGHVFRDSWDEIELGGQSPRLARHPRWVAGAQPWHRQTAHRAHSLSQVLSPGRQKLLLMHSPKKEREIASASNLWWLCCLLDELTKKI